MNGLPVSPGGGPPPGGASNEPRRPDQRLGKRQRLVRSSCFDEAFAQQNKHAGRYMILWVRTADDAALRLGVIASRKVGGGVQRTRARRLLKDVYRRNRHRMAGRCDVVLVARAALLKAAPGDIEDDLMKLARHAGLVSVV